MSDPVTAVSEPSPGWPPPVGKTGHPVVAWIVIGVVIAFVLVRHALVATKAQERFDQVMQEVQGRYAVGVADLLGQRNESLYGQVKTLDGQVPEQHLRFITLAGELSGPEQALTLLHKPTEEGAPADAETVAALEAIYEDAKKNTPPTPPPAAVELIRERLGWFGELAAAPPGTADTAARAAALAPARRTAAVFLSAAAIALLGVVAGIGVLVVAITMVVGGTLRPRLATGSPYGGIYAETFAAWMVLFCALGFASRFIPESRSDMLLSGLASLLSLAALAWPVARGVPWRTVLVDVGLAAPRRPGVEAALGFATYALALPLLAAGVVAMLVLMGFAKGLGLPTEVAHPLAPFIVKSGAWGRVQAVLIATVAAPVVEETMFRGVLYRHLRESTADLGRGLSVLLGVLLVSFVFAVIHPQGWLGVPPLMGLAAAFCLAREWRGTLIPSMVAHALQNGAVTLMMLLAVS
jgi:membrane protease YdiL (CAAX protease family)